jgi:hypothetical protein
MNVQVDDGLSGCGQQSMVGVIRAFGKHGLANKQYQVDQPGRFIIKGRYFASSGMSSVIQPRAQK